MVTSRCLWVVCLFVSTVSANESSLTAIQWLEKVDVAMKTLNYQGTLAFVKENRLDTRQYFHRAEDGKEQERLLSLNSPIRDVVRDSGEVRCFSKEENTLVVNHHSASKSFIINLPDDFSKVDDIYRVTLEESEVIASRPAQALFIQAKDGYRYSRKVWVDKQYFLPLKMELYDLSGVVIEQAIFTGLQVTPQAPLVNVDSNDKSIHVKHIHQAKAHSINDSDIVLGQIPQGFHTVFFTRMRGDTPSEATDHLLLSDGFSSISIYKEEKNKGTQEGAKDIINQS